MGPDGEVEQEKPVAVEKPVEPDAPVEQEDPIAATEPVAEKAPRQRVRIPFRELAAQTLTILRNHPLPFLAAAFLGYSVDLTVRLLALRGSDLTGLSDVSALAIQALDIILKVLMVGVAIRLAAAAARKEPLTLGGAYTFAALRLPVYLITAVMAYAISGLGLALLVVPGISAIALFAFWRQAVVLEGYGASFALARSATLARPMIFRLAGLLILLSFVRQLPLLPSLVAQAPAIWAASSASQAQITATFTRLSRRLATPQLAASVWQMLLDPPTLVFMTMWYLRLKRADGPPETFA
jgi:hypothetical protein